MTKLVNLTAHVADVSFTLVLKDAVRLWDYMFINIVNSYGTVEFDCTEVLRDVAIKCCTSGLMQPMAAAAWPYNVKNC